MAVGRLTRAMGHGRWKARTMMAVGQWAMAVGRLTRAMEG